MEQESYQRGVQEEATGKVEHKKWASAFLEGESGQDKQKHADRECPEMTETHKNKRDVQNRP